MLNLLGLHHLTAVSSRIRDNKRFYTEVLGMRLVKRSVNQDDTSAYHLFYADGEASPGTDLTFFDWDVPQERRGNHTVTRTGLRVNGRAALDWWHAHLSASGVTVSDVHEQDGRLTLTFDDPEGQRLMLVDDGGHGPAHPWEASTVPAAHQIRGLGPVTMSVPNLYPTDVILQKLLNMTPLRTYPHPDDAAHTVHVYRIGREDSAQAGPGNELHVAVRPGLPVAQPGAGGVHHVAFNIPDADYDAWVDRLQHLGVQSSGPVDRYYFRSLYFREPNGVLFELATEGPGFAVDEDAGTLGEKVVLPPFLEPQRAQIIAGLKPID
ncbi:ring-cleaving dioxygenase [Deinococcus aquiradiocola]|uniref:Glyoxalase n=1 Tax=Deinococcus aquiradiocola TaxID=393059 RepID=A0A917PLJ4_9DEIO|nr:ring-cleaving dioxygenase [Deinococcus aquiradiocola]GGJ84061.1 glyoxalase [Deinococcus aquiradiocola]